MTTMDLIAADAAIAEEFRPLEQRLLEEARLGPYGRDGIIPVLVSRMTRGYEHCRRGIFGAFTISVTGAHERELMRVAGANDEPWIDTRGNISVSLPAYNRPAPELLNACWMEGEKSPAVTCVRDQVVPGDTIGRLYENCPAVHALEGLVADPDEQVDWVTVWVESGGTMPGTPGAKWMQMGEGDVYPCLRCLSRAAWRGIKALAWLNSSDAGEVQSVKWCDVVTHARWHVQGGRDV